MNRQRVEHTPDMQHTCADYMCLHEVAGASSCTRLNRVPAHGQRSVKHPPGR
jgi:hypothetical protein